ncbi:LamG domain-containing protein [bacterium]|nr:LamG domain-containing protein [bacterium]
MSVHNGPRIPNLVFAFDPETKKELGVKYNITTGNTVGTSSTYYTFNGTSSIIRFPSRTLTEWTAAYWFYDTSTGTNYNMTFGQEGDTNNRMYHRDDAAAYQLRVHNNANVSVGDLSMSNQRGTWTFVAYSLSASTRRGWVNGVSGLNSTNSNSAEMIFDSFGNPYTSSTYFWTGHVGPAYLYDRQLTDAEVLDLYNLNAARFGL